MYSNTHEIEFNQTGIVILLRFSDSLPKSMQQSRHEWKTIIFDFETLYNELSIVTILLYFE